MSKPSGEKNISIPEDILKELLTPSELRMLKNRWQILNLLRDNISIRKIAKEVKVGTDTVVRVARMSKRTSLKNFLDKDYLTKKLNPQTPWIFGKK